MKVRVEVSPQTKGFHIESVGLAGGVTIYDDGVKGFTSTSIISTVISSEMLKMSSLLFMQLC